MSARPRACDSCGQDSALSRRVRCGECRLLVHRGCRDVAGVCYRCRFRAAHAAGRRDMLSPVAAGPEPYARLRILNRSRTWRQVIRRNGPQPYEYRILYNIEFKHDVWQVRETASQIPAGAFGIYGEAERFGLLLAAGVDEEEAATLAQGEPVERASTYRPGPPKVRKSR